MTTRWPALLLALTACEDVDRWGDIDHELETVQPGEYATDVHIVLKARLGPLPLQTATCDRSVPLTVDFDADPVISGTVRCTLPRIGEVDADISGRVAVPYVDGTVEARDHQAGWMGGFTASDEFFGEIEGTENVNGIVVTWKGWFEAVGMGEPAL